MINRSSTENYIAFHFGRIYNSKQDYGTAGIASIEPKSIVKIIVN